MYFVVYKEYIFFYVLLGVYLIIPLPDIFLRTLILLLYVVRTQLNW